MSVHPTFKRMTSLLEAVAPIVLAETWNYFHNAARKDDDGKEKYTGILFYVEDVDGIIDEYTVGELADYVKSLETVKNKILCMKEKGVTTSIEGRDTNRKPPFWGGAAFFSSFSSMGITGATEIHDYLLLMGAALTAGEISTERYGQKTSLECPGIRESLTQFGLSAGGYMSLKASVEAYFRGADQELAP